LGSSGGEGADAWRPLVDCEPRLILSSLFSGFREVIKWDYNVLIVSLGYHTFIIAKG
jgi:hypothetical protein